MDKVLTLPTYQEMWQQLQETGVIVISAELTEEIWSYVCTNFAGTEKIPFGIMGMFVNAVETVKAQIQAWEMREVELATMSWAVALCVDDPDFQKEVETLYKRALHLK